MTHSFRQFLAVATAAALMLAGCDIAGQPTSAPVTSPSTSSSREPVTGRPHRRLAASDLDAAAVAGARALASSDTAVDADPTTPSAATPLGSRRSLPRR